MEIELEVPNRWKAATNKFYYWDYQPIFVDSKTVSVIEKVPGCTHTVAGFYVNLPDELVGDEKSVMLSEHPFPQSRNGKMKDVTLYIEGDKSEEIGTLKAALRIKGEEVQSYLLPVEVLEHKEYMQKYDEMYHGI